MARALVTGATGFIGRHLVDYLLRLGLEVRVLVRDKLQVHGFPPVVEVYEGNLFSADSLKGLCENIDTVFHLAGYAHAWSKGDSDFSQKHFSLNFEGTKYLFEDAVRFHVKNFVYFSTVKVLDDFHSPYAQSKKQAEDFILKEGDKHQIHTCIIRPALVYGPGWKGNLSSMFHAIEKGYFPLLPAVKNKRSMVSVDDVCRAAVEVCKNTKANLKAYVVTDNISYSTRDIYDYMRISLRRQKSKMYVPYWFLKLAARAGDTMQFITNKRFIFNSESLDKLLGDSFYSSELIQQDIGFLPKENLQNILPKIMTYQNAKKSI